MREPASATKKSTQTATAVVVAPTLALAISDHWPADAAAATASNPLRDKLGELKTSASAKRPRLNPDTLPGNTHRAIAWRWT